jgi:hypothetical protein
MKKNVGNTDKLIRLIFALLVAVLYFTNVINGTLALVLGIAALAMVITSMLNFCGLYAILGISTCKTKETK